MQKLQVPENIPLRWEIVRGFGRPELLASSGITAVVLALAVLYCLVSGRASDRLAATAAVVFTFAFCVGLFRKIENNQSIFDYLVRRVRFQKEQQVFLYRREKDVIRLVEEKGR